MTKAKRFLSAVMAVVMVLTMLSCLGVVASAYVHDVASEGSKWSSETTPGGPGAALSYETLAGIYGDTDVNTTSPWVYLALEAYEKVSDVAPATVDTNHIIQVGNDSWTLTDHYVQPGQELYFIFYQKSNCYGGTWQYSQQFDRQFFDVLSTSYTKLSPLTPATKGYASADDFDGSGLYTKTYVTNKKDPAFFGGVMNSSNPYWDKGNELIMSSAQAGKWKETKPTNGVSKCGLDAAITNKWDCIYAILQAGTDDTTTPELFNDEYLYSFKLKVRTTTETYQGGNSTFNPVPEGTVGHIGIDNNMTRISGTGKYIYTNLAAEEGETLGAASNMNLGGSVPAIGESAYMTEDCNHTFKIGNPGSGPSTFNAKFYDGQTEYTDLAQNGTSITLPAAQTKTGYTFSGWSDGTNTYVAGASYTLTQDTDFTAVWTEDTYTIKYYDGASEYASLAQSATYTNNTITLPAAQTKSGFRFAGWNDGTTTYQPGASYTVSADTNFSAVWTQLYTATFVDEDSTSYGSYEYAAGETITYPTGTAREGYTYAWDPAGVTTMPAADTTFTLRWTAAGSSITLETNGGTLPAGQDNPITGPNGSQVTAPADPTKTGYTFAGWYADADLSTPYTFTTMPATGITVYARWTANPYNANFYITGESEPYDTVVAYYDSTFTAPALPSEEGYSFSAWTPNDFVMNAEGRDYYTTKTANTYTITFKDRNGNVIQSGNQTFGNALSIPAAPSITGETFSGWSGNDGSFIAADATGVTVPAGNITYTATYGQVTYTVTYYVDGVQYGEPQSYTYGANIIPPSYTVPAGKTWSGWQNLPLTMPANNVTVTSTLTDIEYTITFLNKDGGVYDTATATYGTVVETLEPATNPTASGYSFAGWDDDGLTVTGNLTISGMWNALSYNLKFVYGEPATEHSGGSAVYGSTLNTASFPDASVEGKSYKWQYDGADIGSSFAVPALPEGSTIVFTAVYSAKTYTLEYQVNGSRVAAEEIPYGTTITPRALPTETGYDVSDWVGLPQDLIMPAQDLVVNCTKTPHVYTNTWYDIDGETVKTTTQEAYGATITAPTIDPNDYPGMQGLQWSPTPGTQAAENMSFYLVGSGSTVDVTVITKTMNLDGTTYTETSSTITGITGRPVSVPVSMQSKTGFTLNSASVLDAQEVAGDGSTTLTVIFDRNQYDITVVDGDTTSTVTYYYEAAVSALTPAGKTGYTFDSWTWTRTANGAAATAPANMPNYALTATAKYTINKYNFVTYIDGVASDPVQVTYDAVVNAPAAQSKEGYTFNGWYSDSACQTPVTFPFNMPAEDVAVYATFDINTYTYTFNTDGGTEIAPITQEYGTAINVANPEKEGYTFKAWSPALPATMGASNQTFTAIYQVNKYTVTFMNGDTVVKTATVDYGTALESIAPATASKTGYTFTGWTYADTDNAAYSGTTVPAFNLVATAQFSVNSYAAVFYAIAGDTGVYLEMDNIEFGTTFTAPECTAPREYYNFVEWSDGNGNTYRPGATITMDTEGKTFTGVWQQDTSACRVESVVRVTQGYYQLGGANYDVTLVAGIQPDTLIISTPNDGTYYLSRIEYEVGRTQMIKNIREENGKEIWTVYLTLEESQSDVYGAYCEVEGVEDSPYMFGVTYDVKDAEAIAADFQSAGISGNTAIRGDVLTWTVTTSTKVAWLKFVGTYTDAAGAEQELITFYKASNYRDGDGVETAKVTDAEGVRTWVIPMMFNYPGNEDLVVQTWNIQYRCTGSSVWETGVVSDGNDGYVTYAPVVTVAKKAEALEPAVPNYEKYTLVSVETDKANASIGDTITFTVVTTSDVSKIRIGFVIVSDGTDNGKTKTATYQTTSSNASVSEADANGLITWTITFKVNKVAQNGAFDVQCRGLNWGEAQTATVAISA